jgi:hypothetical protein
VKKTFEQWLETASTSTLEANLHGGRSRYESQKIREELNRRNQSAANDTGTMNLFESGNRKAETGKKAS